MCIILGIFVAAVEIDVTAFGQGLAMAITAAGNQQLAWWKELTREQWHAWIAAWLGWTLDAFDFTIFLLLMLPISLNV